MPDDLRITIYIAQSVDGYIARPDGDVGWLEELEPLSESDDGGFAALLTAVDAVVMGRHTFAKVLESGWWGYGAKPVIVLSRSLAAVPEHLRGQVAIQAGEPAELVAQWRAAGLGHIYLDGGQVIQVFLRAGLVDDLTITTLPVLLGRGIPLFGELAADVLLERVAVGPWGRGSVQAVYRVRG